MLLRFTTTHENQEYVIEVLSKRIDETGKVTVEYRVYNLRMLLIEIPSDAVHNKFLDDIRIMFMGQERGYL